MTLNHFDAGSSSRDLLRFLATVGVITLMIAAIAIALPPEWRHPTWILGVIGVLLGLAQIARGVARRWRS